MVALVPGFDIDILDDINIKLLTDYVQHDHHHDIVIPN